MTFQLCRPAFHLSLLAMIAINVVISLFTPVHIVLSGFQLELIYAATSILILMALGRSYPVPSSRPFAVRAVAYLCEGILLLVMMLMSLRSMDQISKVFAPPFADGWLIRADELLSINWLAYFDFIHDHPALHRVLSGAYDNLEIMTAVTAVALLMLGRLDRTRLLLESFIICAIISIAFGAVFPANAAVATLIPDLAAYPNFAEAPGIYHIEMLATLRDPNTTVLIGPNPMPGLVTFPSLHTANGVLLIIACWRTPLFLPALGYGAIMIPATPIWGGHYFIDLIAGTVMAVGVVWVLGRQRAYAGVWSATNLWPRRGRTLRPNEPLHP